MGLYLAVLQYTLFPYIRLQLITYESAQITHLPLMLLNLNAHFQV